MDGNIRIFVLQETRLRDGVIDNVTGTIGRWPFQRAISYQPGVNCDAIVVRDEMLQVFRRGRMVAVAELIGNPTLLARLLRSLRRALLPSRRPGSQDPEWEDLLRPRRSK